MARVLITGGTGFIGTHLTRRCIAAGHRVTVMALPGDPGIPNVATWPCDVVTGDISDGALMETLCEGQEIVFHCAAVVSDWAPRALFNRVNVTGMENVCRAALKARVRRLVEISTNDIFGLREDVVMDETFPLKPWGEPYPDTKIAATQIAWRYRREHGLPVTMVFPCWVYGPGDKTFVPLTADAIVKGDMLFWRRDVIVWPTFVGNLVDLLILISERDEAVGQGYLVHDGEATTFQKFCRGIAATLDVPPPRLHIPYGAAYAAAWMMEAAWRILGIEVRPLLTTYSVKNLGSRLRFSIAKARRELGWEPAVSYAQGFAQTMTWLKRQDRTSLKGK